MEGIQWATVCETSKRTHTCHSGLQRIGARAVILRSQFCYTTPKTQESTWSRWDSNRLDTASGLNAVEALYRLTVKIWRDCSRPDIWKFQEIVLLHKEGSPKDCSNYLTIALISHASKILLIILLNRIRQTFENELPDEQAGFWRRWGTADMLCCIQNVIEKTLLMSEWTFIVFIDYSKAFDSVSHIQMFNILNDMGFPRHSVALMHRSIRRRYWRKINVKFTVRIWHHYAVNHHRKYITL